MRHAQQTYAMDRADSRRTPRVRIRRGGRIHAYDGPPAARFDADPRLGGDCGDAGDHGLGETSYRLELLIAAAAAAMAAWMFAMVLLYRQVGQRQTANQAVPGQGGGGDREGRGSEARGWGGGEEGRGSRRRGDG